jgi:hypothetical protein
MTDIRPGTAATDGAALAWAESGGAHARSGAVPDLTRLAIGELNTETVEFAALHSANERPPLGGREPENRTIGILAVANADLAVGQARNLDAVTVREAQRTLDPADRGNKV